MKRRKMALAGLPGSSRQETHGQGSTRAPLQTVRASRTHRAAFAFLVQSTNDFGPHRQVILCVLTLLLPLEVMPVSCLWCCLVLAGSVSVAAQWGKVPEPNVPRDEKGAIRYDAPTPRTVDGRNRPDLTGMCDAGEHGPPPRAGGAGRQGRGGRGGAAPAAGAPAGAQAAAGGPGPTTGGGPPVGGAGRGGVSLEPATAAFPYDPKGPPVATFFEAGGNMEGGLPYTPWAAEIRKQRLALGARDNPDAMCLPLGFLQFHQQPRATPDLSAARCDPDRVRVELRSSPQSIPTAASCRRRENRSRSGTATPLAAGRATPLSSRPTIYVAPKTVRATGGSTSMAVRTAGRPSSPSASGVEIMDSCR
jgi:hypothetical protein